MRQWLPRDRDPFFDLSSDPKVMEKFPSLLNREESDRMADECQALGGGPASYDEKSVLA